jgi:hypothetical protein
MALSSADWGISTTGAATKMASVGFDSNSVVYDTEVTVTSAELLNLFAAPKTLVAAPGTHSVIDLISCTIFYDYGNAAYATVGNNLALKYVNGSGVAASGNLAETGFLDQTNDVWAKVLPVAVAASTAAQVENQILCLTVGTASPITGTGLLRIHLHYRIVTTPT